MSSHRIRSASQSLIEIDLDAYQHAPDRQRIVSAFSPIARESVASRISQSENEYGDTMPWPKTHNLIRFRPHEVSAWIGPNGDGKSLMLGALAFQWALQGRRTLVCSLEMDVGTQLIRMARQALCKSDFNYDEMDLLQIRVGMDLFFFDFVGQVSPDRIFSLCSYAATRMKVSHIVIDNLTMVVPPGRNSDEDAARFVAGLVQIGRETGIHIHIVGHIRKPDDDKRLSRYDWRGTGACSDMVHNVFIVQSNSKKRKANEQGKGYEFDKEPDHYVRVDKQRNGEYQGDIGLWWRSKSLNWSESGFEQPIPIDLDQTN